MSAENDADYTPTWRVVVPVEVTANSREEAIRYALDDLRDPSMDWDYFEVQQLDGPHPKHGPGLCPICGHHGDDCEGYVLPPGASPNGCVCPPGSPLHFDECPIPPGGDTDV